MQRHSFYLLIFIFGLAFSVTLTEANTKTGRRIGNRWDKSFVEKVEPKAKATPSPSPYPYYPY
jgi:hypothetical protein